MINYLLEFVAEEELLFTIVENMIVRMVHKTFALVLDVLTNFKNSEMNSAFKGLIISFILSISHIHLLHCTCNKYCVLIHYEY